MSWYVATPGDWPEDFEGENGMYHCKCVTCGNTFTGYKRRVTCKVCHNPVPPSTAQLEALYKELYGDSDVDQG